MEITGYARRSWIEKSSNSLKFKVGKSYINSFLLPKFIKIFLFKKRFLYFFSFDYLYLYNLIYQIWNLKKSDPYKAGGIRLKSVDLKIKQLLNNK